MGYCFGDKYGMKLGVGVFGSLYVCLMGCKKFVFIFLWCIFVGKELVFFMVKLCEFVFGFLMLGIGMLVVVIEVRNC